MDLVASAMAGPAAKRAFDPEGATGLDRGPLQGGLEPVVLQGHAGDSIQQSRVVVAAAAEAETAEAETAESVVTMAIIAILVTVVIIMVAITSIVCVCMHLCMSVCLYACVYV